jgi:hypothetical protein
MLPATLRVRDAAPVDQLQLTTELERWSGVRAAGRIVADAATISMAAIVFSRSASVLGWAFP